MNFMHDVVLKVRHLTVKLKSAGKVYRVVDDICFDLKRGQTLALVGESGCGKSMTALSILRILPDPPTLPPEGEVIYEGQNLLTLKNAQLRHIRGRRIAMIFQDPLSALNPVYTIGGQLLESAQLHLELEGEKAIAAVVKALEDVHLPSPKEVMHLYPHQLSGGMLQRAMIAMALICSPDILIADEPTTALDVTIQAQILNLLKELQDKRGMAILLITHDMGVVAQNSAEVIVMYAGHQVEQGSVQALFDHPAHPYTQALFAARPNPHLRKKKLAAISGSVPSIAHLPEGCPFHPRCKYALELCKGGAVPTFQLKERGHHARCWLYDKELDAKLETEPLL
jgi:oligopeptide/dipeptide ABC transporter ATP-binding protein